MLLWSQVNERALQSLIGALMLAAAVLVVAGLVRAVRGRRRYQLIIPDMSQADVGPPVISGLSPRLRQEIRKFFNSESALESSASLVETVGKDIAGGIDDGLHSRVKDIPRLQLEVLAAPRDEMGMLAGGIRAVSPDRAEGLLGALSAALPVQRGSIVQLTPRTRDWGGLHQVGLTLEAGPIDRAHHASATFWPVGAASGTTGNVSNERDQLADLLEPAANWIGIYLMAGSLPVSRSKRLSFSRAFHGKDLRDETEALRNIFAGQLATYEMFWYSDKEPLITLGFSAQALDDAYRAMRVLKKYFRPHYLAGTIHEHRGNALIALKDVVSDAHHAADSRLMDSYAGQASKSFDKAHEEFDRALRLLDQSGGAANVRAAQLRPEFRVRGLKAALRGSNPSRVLDQVNEKITWTTLEQRYNVACLYAVASAVADSLGRDGQEFARRSRTELVAVLGQDPTLADTVESDTDLRLAFSSEKLHDLVQDACGGATAKSSAQSALQGIRGVCRLGEDHAAWSYGPGVRRVGARLTEAPSACRGCAPPLP